MSRRPAGKMRAMTVGLTYSRSEGGVMKKQVKALAKSGAKAAAKPPISVQHLPAIAPGKYAEGLSFDEIRYLECKLILKPNHFTSRQSLFDFAEVLRRPARHGRDLRAGDVPGTAAGHPRGAVHRYPRLQAL